MPIKSGLGLRDKRSSTIAAARRAAEPFAPRVLPDFLIVGAQKAATTSLYAYLTGHPDVRPALRKEVHFFDHHYHRGQRWYRSQFPSARAGQRSWVTGEATPYYLLHPHAAQRAATLIPDVRIIVLLRNPIDRALSHFVHSRSLGMEPLTSFAAAIDAEEDRTEEAWRRLADTGRREPTVEWFSYLRRGQYAAQLRRWQQCFPAESMLVLLAEDLFADAGEVLRSARTHLGLPARPTIGRLPIHHARRYADMPAPLRHRIGQRLAGDVAELETMLGRPTGWQL